MKLIKSADPSFEPEWNEFSISSMPWSDWNGDFVNVFSSIRPRSTPDDTRKYGIQCARDIAGWILANANRFGSEDRFQIIVGWHKDVRSTGRQIVKAGGDYKELEALASGVTEIKMRVGWAAGGVFEHPTRDDNCGGDEI